MTNTNEKVLIDNRFPLFDQDGTLAEVGREIWDLIDGEGEAVARAFAVQYVNSYSHGQTIDPERETELARLLTPYVALKFPNLADQKWVDQAGHLAGIAARIAPLTAIIAGISAAAAQIQKLLGHRLAGDPERLARVSRGLTQATLLEVDVF